MADPRTVIVTGAAGALGGVVLAALHGAGWSVVAFAREASLGGLDPATHAFALPVDLLDGEAVRGATEEAASRTGRIDALVCLAGGYFGGVLLAETPTERLQQQLSLNLVTAFNAVHAVLPHLVASGGGTIVGVSSRPAIEVGAGSAAYAIAKLGVVKLVQEVAAEYRDEGVRANVIVPSTIDTPANRAGRPAGRTDRWVRPEAIAAVIRFLVSDDASVISGATIPVYGRA
ncbi:MAG: SDR family oxidoreductase [Dehalococcoidia bacterium]